MSSSYNPLTGDWEIEWPGRVSRHDLFYGSPPSDPMQGIPLGNGDVGALAWCDGSRLIFALNKCDLWDDGPSGVFHNWKAEEEEASTTLRHAGRLVLDFSLPVFDILYLADFEARLSLSDAKMSLRASGPFGTAACEAFVDYHAGLLWVSAESALAEPVPLVVRIERFGSRTFSHWYSLVRRDPAIGLAGTEAEAADGFVSVSQQLSTGRFAFGCALAETGGPGAARKGGLTVRGRREHSRAAALEVSGAREKRITIVAGVTSPDGASRGEASAIAAPSGASPGASATGAPPRGASAAEQAPAARLRESLDRAAAAGRAGALEAHSAAWKAFWLRSFMESGNDYLDNLWHLTMYYACASQRGPYPGRFINGLWTWNGDVQNWNFYFHWNQQQVYWPLSAAGHHDLAESYLRYRFDSLPRAREDAGRLFGAQGAFVSDVAERRGHNSSGESANHTPVAEIALDFWRQYQYTGDTTFLKDRALPYIREAALFFESLFEPHTDGRLHAKEGTGYEGWIKLRDAVTELVYARALLETALRAAEAAGSAEPRAGRWREMLGMLAPLPVIEEPEGCFEKGGDASLDTRAAARAETRGSAAGNAGSAAAGGAGAATFARGFFKGEAAPGRAILSAGWGIQEGRYLTSRRPTRSGEPTATSTGEPAPEAGGSARPATDAFELLQAMEQNKTPYTNARDDMSYHDGIFPTVEFSAVYPSGLVGLSDRGTDLFRVAATTLKLYAPDCMGWDPLPIALARLGMGRETAALLARWPRRWQYYCNGFGHYGPRDVFKPDAALRFRMALVRDAAAPEGPKFPFPAWPFRHMGMESMSVLAAAMNETLLQSHDGTLRIAPACHESQSARFTLHAIGGFTVSAEIHEGEPLWVGIRSLRGNTIVMENPWPRGVVYRNGRKEKIVEAGAVKLQTAQGDHLVFVPDSPAWDDWKVVPASAHQNTACKTDASGFAMLGLPRMF